MALLRWKIVVTPQAFGICDQEKSLARFGGGRCAAITAQQETPRAQRSASGAPLSLGAHVQNAASKIRLRRLCARSAQLLSPQGLPSPGKQRPAAARSAGIKESTELKQDLNPEARALIAPALDLMEDAVLRYEIAALLAHRHEEAREIGAAVRWHQRAAEWAGIGDIRTALPHWQKVRELVRQGADVPQTAALRVVACSKALAHGWRLGTSATDWAELFEEGCAAARRVGNLAALAALNANYGAVRGLNDGIASLRPLCQRGGADRRQHGQRGAPLRDPCLSVFCARMERPAAAIREARR